MVFQRNGSVYQRHAGVNYDVGNLKEVLTTGMAAGFVSGFTCRTVHDNFHSTLLGFQRYVDVHGVDAGMREYPDTILGIEVIVLHDFLSVTLCSFQEKELVDTHLTDDLRKERQREFAKRVEAYETADARIHLFNGDSGVTATKGVNPTACFNSIRHNGSCFFNVLQLSSFQLFHDAVGIF